MKIEAKQFVGDYSVDAEGKPLIVLGAVFDMDMLTKLSNPDNFTVNEVLSFFAIMMAETQKTLAINVLTDAITGTSRASTPTPETVDKDYQAIMNRYKTH